MDCFSNKILLFEKDQIKNNVNNNFGVIKNTHIVESDLINNLNKKTNNHKNLLVIPHHLKNLFLSKKNIENCQFFRKNKKINNKNIMITDHETSKYIQHIINLLVIQTRINSNKECRLHHMIRNR